MFLLSSFPVIHYKLWNGFKRYELGSKQGQNMWSYTTTLVFAPSCPCRGQLGIGRTGFLARTPLQKPNFGKPHGFRLAFASFSDDRAHSAQLLLAVPLARPASPFCHWPQHKMFVERLRFWKRASGILKEPNLKQPRPNVNHSTSLN